MNHKYSWILVALILGACGDDAIVDSGPGTPPDNPIRDIPALGGPDGDEDFETPDELFGLPEDPTDQDLDIGDPTLACCPTTFAISDQSGTADETRVELIGTQAPLLTPTAMAFADGVWTVELCVPPKFSGTYHYDFIYDDGDDAISLTLHNEFAPNEEILNVFENIWVTADTCDDAFPAVHARTSDD